MQHESRESFIWVVGGDKNSFLKGLCIHLGKSLGPKSYVGA